MSRPGPEPGTPERTDEEEVVACRARETFRTSLEEADCAVVVAAPSGDPEVLADLRLVRESDGPGAGVPLVLCVPRSSGSLRRLGEVSADEIVWLDALEEELAAAVQRAEAERRFRDLRRRLAERDDLSPTLSEALGRALTRRPPVTSVQRLAREVDRDRRTLWHHWNRAVRSDAELTLKAFLDWIVLLRAAVERTDAESWEEVADEFGVHARTLRRAARRRTEDPLGRLTNGGLEPCFRAFEEEVLPLLGARERPS